MSKCGFWWGRGGTCNIIYKLDTNIDPNIPFQFWVRIIWESGLSSICAKQYMITDDLNLLYPPLVCRNLRIQRDNKFGVFPYANASPFAGHIPSFPSPYCWPESLAVGEAPPPSPTSFLQRGHDALIFNHLSTHSTWKTWKHGSSFSSSLSAYFAKQIQQTCTKFIGENKHLNLNPEGQRWTENKKHPNYQTPNFVNQFNSNHLTFTTFSYSFFIISIKFSYTVPTWVLRYPSYTRN